MATKKKKDKIVVAFESPSSFRYHYRVKKTLTQLTKMRKYCKIARQHVVCERKKV